MKTMYVDVHEIMEDWGVCKAKGYQIIKKLNDDLKISNPKAIVIAGKCNRKYYEESCLGIRS